MNKDRVESIDTLRVVAILAVVMIHTTTRVLEATQYNLSQYPWTLFLNQMSRFAVPLFFLISGFVLEISSKHEMSYFSFLKKRFAKIFVPYLFWSLIYYYFVFTNNHDSLVRLILTGSGSYQLYFIPTLCIFYIAFPLLHKLYKYISMPVTLVTLAGLQLWLLYQDYFIKNGGADHPLRIVMMSFFVFLIGIVAARNKEKIFEFAKRYRFPIAAAATYLAYYIFKEGYNLYYKTYNVGAIYSQYRPSILLYTLLIGILFYYLVRNVNLQRFSNLSYLVFFVHVIILDSIWNLFSKFVNPNPIFDVLFFLTVSVVSFLTAFVAHKIPKLNKLTG
jgi:surface polysaccharide O-acyltransferase-like enzyme